MFVVAIELRHRCDAGQFEATRKSDLLNLFRGNGQSVTTSNVIVFILPYMPTSFPALLDFQHVFVQRGDRHALDDFSLTIGQGEHLAILGPNGSGKSTLIKTITHECYPLLRPETQCRVLGEQAWNIFELRSKIGLVSNDLMAQATRDITGRELVVSGFFGSIGIWPHHIVTEQMEYTAREVMTQLGCLHLKDRWLNEVSSGEARRLLISRALIHRPSTLLLDEPTTSLDLAGLHEMRIYLQQLARSGVNLLLVTHHLDDIVPEIERVVLLKQGQVAADGKKGDILTAANLSALFGLRLEVAERDGYYHAW